MLPLLSSRDEESTGARDTSELLHRSWWSRNSGSVANLIKFNMKVASRRKKLKQLLMPIVINVFLIVRLRGLFPDQKLPVSKFLTVLDSVRDCVPNDSTVSFLCDHSLFSESYCDEAFSAFSNTLESTSLNVTRSFDPVDYRATILSDYPVFGANLLSPTELDIDVPPELYPLLSNREVHDGKTCRSFSDPECGPVQFVRSCASAVEFSALNAMNVASGGAPSHPTRFQVMPQHPMILSGLVDSPLLWLIPLYLSGLFLNVFNFALIEQVSEKEGQNRDYLTCWGISKLVHFMAWLVTNLGFGLLAVVAITVGLTTGGVFSADYQHHLFYGCFLYLLSLLSLAYIISVKISSIRVASNMASLADIIFNMSSLSVGAIHNRAIAMSLALIPTVPFFLLIRAIGYEEAGSSGSLFSTNTALLISFFGSVMIVGAGVLTSLKDHAMPAAALVQEGPEVSIRGLWKRYPPDDTAALKGVDIHIPAGQVTCLIGGNGAGKSTLIHSLLGVVEVTECNFFTSPSNLDIAVCLQDDAVWESLTVQDHIDFFGIGLAKADPYVLKEYLERLSLSSVLDQQCDTLSGGQKRRLSTLLALLKAELDETKLVILDEPTTGVDVAGRRVIREFIKRTARTKGKAVLLTTHYLDEAQELSDRVIFLSHGEVKASGSRMELQSSDLLKGGYVVKFEPTDMVDVVSQIRQVFSDIVTLDRSTVKVLSKDSVKLESVLCVLEEMKSRGEISYFSVDSVSLENLFTEIDPAEPTCSSVTETGGESVAKFSDQIYAMARIRILPVVSSFGSFFSTILFPIVPMAFWLVARRIGLFGAAPISTAADHYTTANLNLVNVFNSTAGIRFTVPSVGDWALPSGLPAPFEIQAFPKNSRMIDILFHSTDWHPFAVDNDKGTIWLNPTSPLSGFGILASFVGSSISVSVSSFLSPSRYIMNLNDAVGNIVLYMVLSLTVISTQCSIQIFDERNSFIKRLSQIQGLIPSAYCIGSVLGQFALKAPIVLFAPCMAVTCLGSVLTEVPGYALALLAAGLVTTAQLILFGYFFVFMFKNKESMLKYNSLYSIVFAELFVLSVVVVILTDPEGSHSLLTFLGSILVPPLNIAAVISELVALHTRSCSLITQTCTWGDYPLIDAGVLWPILGGLVQVIILVRILVMMERGDLRRITKPDFYQCAWMINSAEAIAEDPSVESEKKRIMAGCDDDILFVKLWHQFPPPQDKEKKSNQSLPPPLKWAVKDLTLGVRRNEVLGLLGKNGAGKTTALSILLGVYSQTAGYAGIWPGKRIGFCPQNSALWDKVSGIEHIRFYQMIRGCWRGPEEAAKWLNSVGLIDPVDQNKPSKSYSGGMKRRLCLAIALIGDPQVLILDEPTAGVDISGKREIWAILRCLGNHTCSVIITTHSLEEAENLCDRISIMDSGSLVRVGSPTELKHAQQKIIVSIDPLVASAEATLLRSIPEARRLDDNKLEVSTASLKISTIAHILSSLKGEKIIRDFTIQQLSLEDVILNSVGNPDRDNQNE